MGRAVVVYESVFGNTKRAAFALGEGIEEGGERVQIVRTVEFSSTALRGLDLLAVGGPTHNKGLSQGMAHFLWTLEGLVEPSVPFFAFDTRHGHPFGGSAAVRIDRGLSAMGLRRALPRASAYVLSTRGPLAAMSEADFRGIGRRLAEAIWTRGHGRIAPSRGLGHLGPL